jgi:S1-C subfamily serine protease
VKPGKEPIKPVTYIIVSIAIIFIVGYFGFQLYQDFQWQKEAKQTKNNNQNTALSSIVSQWRPRIIYIECEFKYTDGTTYAVSSGSGFAAGAVIDTNKHILIDENGYGPSVCYVKYPDDTTIYRVLNGSDIWVSEKYDVGHLIVAMNDTIKNLNSSEYRICSLEDVFGNQKALVGDDIIILGYPTIGSQSDITVTKGIISGYDDDYYITDAKIEHGNSGGAAILLKDNCYLGIPSYAISGEVESLARILNSRAVFSK